MKINFAQHAGDELRARVAGETASPRHFLKHFWQKRPLLIRRAFPAFRDPITRDELAGLACEDGVESRLVMEQGGAHPWQVIPGPQRESRLRQLPPTHWTLLVQGVDRWVPGVAALLEPFRFIPDWRVDDVMVSFAPNQGTVGPHIDSYDVFLLQGQGRRRWRIDSKAPTALHPGLDLRVLRQFHSEADWTLEAGDMLYLPPNLAHYGVALEECLTFSIGFRSPSAMDLLAATHERLLQQNAPPVRYSDPELRKTLHAGEISRLALTNLRHLLDSTLRGLDSVDFDDMLGELLTEPKASTPPEKRRTSAARLRRQLKRGASLVRSSESRMGFLGQGKATRLFVDGRRVPLGPGLAFAGPLITSSRRLTAPVLSSHLRKAGFLPLLASLLNTGAFKLGTEE